MKKLSEQEILEEVNMATQAINIVFDGPPGPEAGRFIEVETDDGKSIGVGEWKERPDGLWALRIAQLPYKFEAAKEG